MLDGALGLLFLVAVSTGYLVVAWRLLRAGRIERLIGWWGFVSYVQGFVLYRRTCSRPMTCDVGGPDAAYHYLTHYTALYTLTGAAGFLAATLLLARSARGSESRYPGALDLVLCICVYLLVRSLATIGAAALGAA
jgi:hypothetical protein